MNQSALVGGALLTGFALFLAARDRLGVYAAVLWGDKHPASAAPAETSPTAGIIPYTGSFDPLDPFDVLGGTGYSISDVLKSLPPMPQIPGFGGGDMDTVH